MESRTFHERLSTPTSWIFILIPRWRHHNNIQHVYERTRSTHSLTEREAEKSSYRRVANYQRVPSLSLFEKTVWIIQTWEYSVKRGEDVLFYQLFTSYFLHYKFQLLRRISRITVSKYSSLASSSTRSGMHSLPDTSASAWAHVDSQTGALSLTMEFSWFDFLVWIDICFRFLATYLIYVFFI